MSRRCIPNVAHTTRWALCAAIAIVALTSMLRDGPSETQAAQDVADYSAAMADGGVSLCKEFHRVPVWTKSGDLVCREAVQVAGQRGAL